MNADVSASASTSSGSGTGGTQFGNVTIGTGAGGSGGIPTWLFYILGAFLFWKFVIKKGK